ncbi:PHP domain-containing protein [Candidatus Omnitrophota bacterium]
MKYADLHIHTIYSDSTATATDVVARSVKEGLSAISITDHDTVEGIPSAVEEGNNHGLEVIPGIEMTSEIDNREIHILGYFVDINHPFFLKKLEELKQIRIDRIYKMIEKLKELGITNLSAQEVIDFSGEGAVGRVHLATMLQKKGWVYSVSEAFYRYLGDDCPAYVSKFKFSPEEIVGIIAKATGVPVLAHPHIYPTSELEQFIASLADAGLRGLEIYYPGYSEKLTETYRGLADKFGLLCTGGSDDHGSAKEKSVIGKVKIPYECVEALKQDKCQKENTT